jgi:dynein heavy chain, axonemal
LQVIVTALTAVTKGPPEKIPPTLFAALRAWKDIDVGVTEAANEARDNYKYLATLERFIAPLYGSGGPDAVLGALPALMNAVKMVYTIARYFNTPERMTDLCVRITQQVIQLGSTA